MLDVGRMLARHMIKLDFFPKMGVRYISGSSALLSNFKPLASVINGSDDVSP